MCQRGPFLNCTQKRSLDSDLSEDIKETAEVEGKASEGTQLSKVPTLMPNLKLQLTRFAELGLVT